MRFLEFKHILLAVSAYYTIIAPNNAYAHGIKL